jgi:hypothetical protein
MLQAKQTALKYMLGKKDMEQTLAGLKFIDSTFLASDL